MELQPEQQPNPERGKGGKCTAPITPSSHTARSTTCGGHSLRAQPQKGQQAAVMGLLVSMHTHRGRPRARKHQQKKTAGRCAWSIAALCTFFAGSKRQIQRHAAHTSRAPQETRQSKDACPTSAGQQANPSPSSLQTAHHRSVVRFDGSTEQIPRANTLLAPALLYPAGLGSRMRTVRVAAAPSPKHNTPHSAYCIAVKNGTTAPPPPPKERSAPGIRALKITTT